MTVEADLIEWLKRNLTTSSALKLGLGDDAAVLARIAPSQPVITTDLLTDGVDFLIEQVEPQQIGHKALGVNLSDLAAMAAQPLAAFVSLVLPNSGSQVLGPLDLAIGIYQGMLPLAEKMGVTIAGGDTNCWDGALAISVTAVGLTTEHDPLTRHGGQPGDQLLVTGQLGGSLLGRHLQVEPRVHEALLLNERYKLHAGIDISDGLALDTSRLAQASKLGAVLDLSVLPISDAANQLSEQDGRSPQEHALGDGEDFELLLAVSREVSERMLREQPLDIQLTRIGELVDKPGLWQQDDRGELIELPPVGFQHGERE